MVTTRIIAAALATITATQVVAQDASFEFSGSIGSLTNQDGGNDIEGNSGIAGTDTRASATLGLSVAYGLANGWTGVTALNLGGFSDADDALDTDDTTRSTADLTVRALSDLGGYTLGGFAGFGTHNDNGDSDEIMTYGYIGAEIAGATSFGGYYAQIGYLDSADEYDEGTQEAPFINLGGSYNITADYTLTGSLGFAAGQKYSSDYDNRIINAAIGVERTMGDVLVSVGYEATQISYLDAGIRSGDTFGSFSIGATYAFGGSADHGSPLPSFGNWVAFNANEVE